MNKTSKKILYYFLFALSCLSVLSKTVFAQEGQLTQAQTQKTPSAFDNAKTRLNKIGDITGFKTNADSDLYSKIAGVINILLGFAGIIATILVIYGGFKWITAQGNEDQVKSARNTIRDAVIGIIIIFLAYVIVNFVVDKLIAIFTATS